MAIHCYQCTMFIDSDCGWFYAGAWPVLVDEFVDNMYRYVDRTLSPVLSFFVQYVLQLGKVDFSLLWSPSTENLPVLVAMWMRAMSVIAVTMHQPCQTLTIQELLIILESTHCQVMQTAYCFTVIIYYHVTLWSESMLWDVSLFITYILWGLSFTVHLNILQCVWGFILFTELRIKKLSIL